MQNHGYWRMQFLFNWHQASGIVTGHDSWRVVVVILCLKLFVWIQQSITRLYSQTTLKQMWNSVIIQLSNATWSWSCMLALYLVKSRGSCKFTISYLKLCLSNEGWVLIRDAKNKAGRELTHSLICSSRNLTRSPQPPPHSCCFIYD
jgi:hypothetical protein